MTCRIRNAFCLVIFISLQCIWVAAQQGSSSTPTVAPATLTSADASPASEVPVAKFVSKSQLVLVPVVVSRNGTPVTGLKKEDFKVFENGKEQKIAVFEEIKADSSPVNVTSKRDPAKREFSNMQVDQQAPKRLVVIVLDLINTGFGDRVYARKQLVKYLSSNIDSGALVSLVALGRGRVRIIHDFTSRPELLIAALDKAAGNGKDSLLNLDMPPDDAQVFENEVNQISEFLETGRFAGAAFGSGSGESGYKWLRIRQTLDGMNLIAQAYAGIPGRKALIWATGGFPFQIDGSTMLLDPEKMGDPSTQELGAILDYYQHTWELLNNANFALYPVDLRGLVVNNVGADQKIDAHNVLRQVQRQSLLHQDTLATFDTFANMTGGRAYYNTNDLSGSFKKATIDSASYYLLAYYLDKSAATEKKKSWHKLKVKVDANNTSVRARSGFFVNDPQQLTYKNEIALALASPLDFTALPVTVRWLDQTPDLKQQKSGESKLAQSQKKVGFEVDLPPNFVTVDTSDNSMALEVVASARSGGGVQANGIAQTVAGHLKPETVNKIRTAGFLFKSTISLPPGRYSVRFVVHDNLSGRTGSVAAPIVVE